MTYSWPYSWFRRFTSAVLILTVLVLFSSCSSDRPKKDEAPAVPAWIQLPTRTVDNGYIVYVEAAEDVGSDRAKFKSESAALADLANECTLIPKGVRIEDRYQTREAGQIKFYAKVAVEFQLCEEAKRAVTPEAVRQLANVPMTEQVKRYQDSIGQTDQMLVADNGDQPVAPFAGGGESGGSGGGGSGGGGTVVVYRTPNTDVQYFAYREQIFVAKRDVVLAPPTAYQPGSPEATTFNTHVTQQTTVVTQYQQTHPDLRNSRTAWSGYRPVLMQQHQLRQQQMRPNGGYYSRPPQGPRAMGAARPPPQQQPRKRRRRRFEGR